MSSSIDSQQSVRNKAVQWLVERHSGTWKSEDEERLNDWLNQDTAHRRAFEQAQFAWDKLGDTVSGDATRIAAAREFRGISLGSRLQQWFIPGISFATATTLVALVVIVPWWNGSPQTYFTARGQQKTITLDDGTRIVLNTRSEIVTRIGHSKRSVELRNGEALFTVIHDESRPFTVRTESGNILDIGTVFNVELYKKQVNVAVLEGEVKVTADRARNQAANLGAGQGVAYDQAGILTHVTQVDAEDVMAWRKWRLVFRNQPLGEALDHLLAYHDISFEFTDPELAQMPISGSFNVQDLKLFLITLENTFPVRVTMIGPSRIRVQRAG